MRNSAKMNLDITLQGMTLPLNDFVQFAEIISMFLPKPDSIVGIVLYGLICCMVE